MAVWNCPHHSQSILDSLKNLKSEDQLCDVTVFAGDEELKCHRLVLVAASEYFKAMFQGDTKEARDGVVEFPDSPSSVVKRCIEFIYSGKVEFTLENISDFMKASDMFCLHGLTRLYVQFLSKNINMENIVEMISLAQVYDNELLKKSLKPFLRKEFGNFLESREYLSCGLDWMLCMLSIVSGCGRDIEVLKWDAIIDWVKADNDERRCSFPALFYNIDVSFLSKDFIRQNILSEDLVRKSQECLLMYSEFTVGGRSVDVKLQQRDDSTRQIDKFKNIVSLNTDTTMVCRYNSWQKEWYPFTNLPVFYKNPNRFHFDITEYLGILYVGIGNELWCWNDVEWKELYKNINADPTYNRCIGCGRSVAMVTSNYTLLHHIDGAKPTVIKHSDEYRWGFFLASTEQKIYVLGGYDCRYSRVVHLKTLEYKQSSQMKESRAYGGGIWYHGSVYAIGGGSESVEFLNTITNNWQLIYDLKIPCGLSNKVHCADKLYIFGGSLGTTIHSVELEKLEVSDKNKQPNQSNIDTDICCISYVS